jgi:hypothetical protein
MLHTVRRKWRKEWKLRPFKMDVPADIITRMHVIQFNYEVVPGLKHHTIKAYRRRGSNTPHILDAGIS